MALSLLLSGVFLLFAPQGVWAAPSGTVIGRIVDQTNGRPVADAEVRLLRRVRGSTPSVRSTRTDRNGQFRFPDVPLGGSAVYLVTTEYRGVPYADGPFVPTAEKPTIVVSLSVFEPTADSGLVAVAYRIILIQLAGPARLAVRDVVGVFSREARAVRDDGTGTVGISLPPGASAIHVLRGAAPSGMRGDRMVDTLPVTPRVRDIAIEYTVEYSGRRALLRWPVDYPTASFDLVLPQSVQVDAGRLRPGGRRTISGRQMTRFAAESLPAGGEVVIALSGLPLDLAPYVGVSAVLAGSAGLGWWVIRPLLRRRNL